jgi:hypothetical protein
MHTCHALFIIEGLTAVPLIRTCLQRLYGSTQSEPLQVNLPSWGERSREISRGKFKMGKWIIGLLSPGGKDNVSESSTILLKDIRRGGMPNLQLLVEVRDMDEKQEKACCEAFLQRMENLARSENMSFSVIREQPALGQYGNLKIAQVLLGDPKARWSSQHTVEDHVLEFLKRQPKRDLSELAKILEQNLGQSLTPKQLVQLSMIQDEYWSAPAGFYERVLDEVPKDLLQALAKSLGLDQLIESLS